MQFYVYLHTITIFAPVTKRIPKTSAPEMVKERCNPALVSLFCEVYIPLAPSVFTYGVPENANIVRGSVVWVQLARRKPMLALVSRVHREKPAFDVRYACPHESGYVFSERYMESLEWVAKYYVSTPMRALNVFWPADFDKYLDALFAEKKAEPRGEAPSDEPEMAVCSDLPPLTDEQRTALDSLVGDLDRTGFRGTLLHGVTGSGKTRVYQELVREALMRKKRVLILVPEIGLTPQTAARFADYLKIPVVVLHSALSAPKKREGYLAVLDGSANVVLGTRSAILSPFEFDVVILDEEHDSSFKQQDPAPRYHTRDLAFHLAQKHGALVVLGSATPCLETYRNAKAGNLKLLTLKNRATAAPLPDVTVVDMGKVRQQKGVLMSPALREALSDCIAGGDQAIILMNRRGYSKIRVCTKCGETLYCRHCHIPLVYHKQYHALMCHYCAALYPLDMQCPSCGAETYEFVGGAIEKLEEEIQEWIADAKVIRMDRDTTQNVGAVEKILTSFRNREYNILLGTQMVAKGHDFPGVKLVGIVGADSGLGVPDFRSTEKLFQLLSQTAGRAGRAGGGGRVFIQTLNPAEPVMQYAIHHDFEGFANLESTNRQMAFYPPFCKLVEISCGSRDESLLRNTVKRLEGILRKESALTVLGPVDAFVPKVQNVYWTKLYVKTQNLSAVRKVLAPILNAAKPWVAGVEIKVEFE